MPTMQPIHTGAPKAAMGQKKIVSPNARNPSPTVRLGRSKKQVPKRAKGIAAKVIFIHEVDLGSRDASTYEPHPTMVAIKAHMMMKDNLT
jgi:hypothetical protein